MRLAILAASVLSISATGAFADAIAEREQIMKERGGLMRVLGPIAQGKEPFDAAVVIEALEKLNENAQKVDVTALWPKGSDTNGTKSSPKIWEDMAGFEAATEKYKADVQAAVDANPQDLEAFQAVFGQAASNCGSCHEMYRLSSN